ncbi:LiaF transmembrane domain-containing protein [Teredinibacter purpureus]|uniref:LiaF transmembrane domain-containing protein n=1 Tax=Teredinibacter purpureus TaxID=2731756 RepID=UPI0005F8595B|nr:hypothetical protein [Teredinibacter purpureus]
MKKYNGKTTPRMLVGIGIIALALLMFFDNIGFTFFGLIISNWPIVLIIVGGSILLNTKKVKNKKPTPAPFILIGLGVVFFLTQHQIFNISMGAIIGPLILLMVGFYILRPTHNFNTYWKKTFSDISNKTKDYELFDKIDDIHSDEDSDTKIDIVSVLSGGYFSTRSQNLTDSSVICVMGGGDIDIREADTKQERIELDVLAFMGGIELKIPPHWQVTVKVLPFLGGISNKTTCLADKLNMPKKHLVISGVAFMGGIEIRN